ncbi:MAG: AMP-binding protein [Bacteroidales bacterium]|jgi:O-succinylbenzoic acid--CoA ligase|nr:AMP-binding protein [Bacteroidales bacterium]
MAKKKLGFRVDGNSFSLNQLNELKAQRTDLLWQETFTFLQEWFDSGDTIIQQSSGSTGPPKQISISKKAMAASAKMTGDFFGFDGTKKLFLCLSPSYIAGKMMIVRALFWETDLIIGNTAANPLAALDKQIDFSAMVPLQLSKIIVETPAKLRLLKSIIIGGSAIDSYLEQQLQQFETAFFHTYGMTETMSHIALRKINGTDKSDWFTPLSGVNISVDERNCLQIDVEKLGIKSLITNDIVSINEDGKFKILGRVDDVIISAGAKIHPLLIEQKLQKLIPNQMLLLGKKDEMAGEIAVLVIEGHFTIKEIYDFWQKLTTLLPAYEMPRRLHFIDQIPLLPSGKADRKGLKESV